jgi:uncharacterized protein YjaZ
METYIETDDYTIQAYSTLDKDIEAQAPPWLQDLEDPGRDRILEAAGRVHSTLEETMESYPTDEDVTIVIGETDEPFIEEEMGGATGGNFGSTSIVCYSPEADGWADELETATAHEYAHGTYIEQARDHGQGDDTYRKWQQVLLEAHGMHIADRMTDSDPPWRDAVDDTYLTERKEDIHEEMEQPAVWTDEDEEGMPFFGGGGDWQRWTGYTLAWRLGEQLLEEDELADLPAMTYEETRDAVDDLLEA